MDGPHFVYSFVDIWVGPPFWLLWTFVCIGLFLYGCMFSFLLGMYLGGESLDCTVHLCVIHWEDPRLFPQWLRRVLPCSIPTSNVRGFQFLRILTRTYFPVSFSLYSSRLKIFILNTITQVIPVNHRKVKGQRSKSKGWGEKCPITVSSGNNLLICRKSVRACVSTRTFIEARSRSPLTVHTVMWCEHSPVSLNIEKEYFLRPCSTLSSGGTRVHGTGVPRLSISFLLYCCKRTTRAVCFSLCPVSAPRDSLLGVTFLSKAWRSASSTTSVTSGGIVLSFLGAALKK